MANARSVWSVLAIGVLLAVPLTAGAAIDYSSVGSTYAQTFDTLAATGTDLEWTNDSTLAAWSLYRVPSNSSLTPPVAITFYDAGDGASSTARFYSFGPASGDTADRALGAIGSGNLGNFSGGGFQTLGIGAVIGWITVGVTNATGSELTQFTVGFAGEQWRDDSESAQTMLFEHGFGDTFSDVTTWSAPGGSFDWDSPVNQAGGAINGNTVGRVSGRGGTVNGLTWSTSTTLWLRWVERNDSGIDHGLAIDDFSFSAAGNAVPEPGAFLFGGLVCGVIGLRLGGRRLLASFHRRQAG